MGPSGSNGRGEGGSLRYALARRSMECSAPYCPGQTVGLFAGLDVPAHLQCFQINDRDIVVRSACYVRARAVRLHEDAGRAASDLQAFDVLARSRIDNGQLRAAQHRDENMFTVRRKFQPVGPADVGLQSLCHFFAGQIQNGNGAILSVGGPQFLAVGRDIETLGASAHGDHRFIPIAPRWAAASRPSATLCSGRWAAGAARSWAAGPTTRSSTGSAPASAALIDD